MPDNFGNRLRALRKKSGLTQPELADLVGVHETTIRRWENNGDKPMPDSFSNLAKALGVSEADLLNEPPPVHKPGEWVINFKTVTRFDDKEVIDSRTHNAHLQCQRSIAGLPSGTLTAQAHFAVCRKHKTYAEKTA